MKIGIIREGKTPPDSRVPLTPQQCITLINQGVDIVVQPSPIRSYKDDEYESLGVPMQEDLNDRDVLLGVKEVPIEQLIANKTYFFFSHTIKEQAYNRPLLKAVIDKNIKLIDYEVITNESGARVIAFGKFAGMVGAHNGLWTYGQKTKTFELPRLKDLKDYAEAKSLYKDLKLPNLKIVLSGTGRVAKGAAMVLDDMGIRKVTPFSYVKDTFDEPVYTQINSFFYAKRIDGKVFESPQDFYSNPKDYVSDFHHFIPSSDIFINGIYWDNDAPAFFTLDQMNDADFNIKVIADVTCDIAPVSSIPSTIKASTIVDPVFGFDPKTQSEVPAYTEGCVDMMTIDNLPNELPRDASEAFGQMFMDNVIPNLLNEPNAFMKRATVTKDKDLGSHFEYLRNYLNGQ